jgi:hypothetical protein
MRSIREIKHGLQIEPLTPGTKVKEKFSKLSYLIGQKLPPDCTVTNENPEI